MESRIKDISECLLANNIKPSYARIKIMEYLLTKKSHPTVEEIFNSLVTEIPTLSKTTVYNTLKSFLKANLVKLVITEENENRYDADISEHGHFKCLHCGVIYDFLINLPDARISGLEDFKIQERNITFKGICSECLKKI